MVESNIHERDLYIIYGEDFNGNRIALGTSAFGSAHAERIVSKIIKYVIRTECLMIGGGGYT